MHAHPQVAMHAHMQVAMQPLLRVMVELRKLDGPLGQLEIETKIGEGGYGVVHQGEGWGRRGVWGGAPRVRVWGEGVCGAQSAPGGGPGKVG